MFGERNKTARRGYALVVVLLIIMAIAVLSMGFLARSDVELACGENMILKTQMDYLAESALEHAKGLILNPQDVASESWTAARQQLFAGSNDYYDVNVAKLGELNYRITGTAYREKGGEQVGRSSLTAKLRLNPCIAVQTGSQWTTEPGTTVNGDVYAKGDLGGLGNINGDAFAAGFISAVNVQGQEYTYVAESNAPVSFPGIEISCFTPQYYIGSNSYSSAIIDENDLNDVNLGTSPIMNPAGVYYRNGNLTLSGNVTVNGTLVVTDNLTIIGTGNCITATKNFPAVIVGGRLEMYDDAKLTITGLAQIEGEVRHTGYAGAGLSIVGALFIKQSNINGFVLGDTINVTAVPNKAAIEIRFADGTAQRWNPAAGAFFKGIARQ
jgi:cytoskeletal protein CcmA (bactofilin family)